MGPRSLFSTWSSMSERKAPKSQEKVRAEELPDDLPGQAAARAVLRQALAAGKLSHAYLVTGPSGSGKHKLAQWWAAILTCQHDSIDHRPCGHCQSCRLRVAGSHPDLQILSSADGLLHREQVVEALHRLNLKPQYSAWQVLVIENADTLSPDAAQALLKTLEEPPESALITLTAPGVDRLPPTVVSRCQVVSLSGAGATEVGAWLQKHGVSVDTAQQAAAISAGLPGRAWEMAHGGLADLDPAMEIVRSLPELARRPKELFTAVSQWADKYAKREDMQRLVLWIGILYRDLWVYALTQEQQLLTLPVLADTYKNLVVATGPYDAARLSRIVSVVEKTLRYLEAYGNPRLALERLVLQVIQGVDPWLKE